MLALGHGVKRTQPWGMVSSAPSHEGASPHVVPPCLQAMPSSVLEGAFIAAVLGQLEVLQALAALGCDLTAATWDGNRLVHWAALAGQLPVLQWLAASGAELTVTGIQGMQAVHFAALMGRLEILQWLASCPGVSLLAPSFQQHSATGILPLHFALIHEPVFEWLLQQVGTELAADGRAARELWHVASSRPTSLHIMFAAGYQPCAHPCARCATGLAALGKRRGDRLAETEAKVRRLTPMYEARQQLAVAAGRVVSARAAGLASWEARVAAEEARLDQRMAAALRVGGGA
jgi:hypothetical protein